MSLRGKSPETMRAELEQLREERRAFARANPGPFREDGHAQLDRQIAEARETLAVFLAARGSAGALPLWPSPAAPRRSLVELASLWTITEGGKFEAALRKAIDQLPTRAAIDKRLAEFDRAIAESERALREHEHERRRAELEAELAQLEAGS